MTDATPLYENFLLQCKASGSLNFPNIARDVGLNWTKDVKPLLMQDADFRVLFISHLEDLKWTYVDSIRIKSTVEGRGNSNTISYVKETIRYLDALINALSKMNIKSSHSLVPDLGELDDVSQDEELPNWTSKQSPSPGQSTDAPSPEEEGLV